MRLLCVLVLSFCVLNAKGSVVEWDLDLSGLSRKNVNSDSETVRFLEPAGHYGGYFSINGTEDGHLFYLYFENRFHNPDAPLMLWTNGGPGCSSFYGLFMENGPYLIQDDLSLAWNSYGWDIGHDILFLDHPLSVGYSYGGPNDTVTKEEQVAEHLLQFFYSFFDAHPKVRSKPLYLAGQSFAGHYLPAIATRIMDANSRNPRYQIRLEGMALGDPWTNPSLQFRSYPYYEYEVGLIDETEKEEMATTWKFCDFDMQLCDPANEDFSEEVCQVGYEFCNSVLFYPIFSHYPTINYYDIRSECLVDGCYNVTKLNAFMNLPEVKQRFDIPETFEWKDCNDAVYFDLYWDCSTDSTPLIADLLDNGVRLLVYVGDQDLICNRIGVRDWINAMNWTGSNAWNETETKAWIVEGEQAGLVTSSGLLTLLNIADCGHMVPSDQPAVAFEMIHTFTSNQTWETTDEAPQTASGSDGVFIQY